MTTKEIEEKPKWLKEESPNFETLRNLGTSVLYLIAPLPEEELPDVETLRHLETSEL